MLLAEQQAITIPDALTNLLAGLLCVVILFLVATAALVAILAAARRRRQPSLRRRPAPSDPTPSPIPADTLAQLTDFALRPSLLTPTEITFYHSLQAATSYHIAPQVRLADLLTLDPDSPTRQASLNRVQSKSIDFVLCDSNTMQPLLAIELDDKTHRQDHRKRRDDFVNRLFHYVGLPILRFPANQIGDDVALEHAIVDALRRSNLDL